MSGPGQSEPTTVPGGDDSRRTIVVAPTDPWTPPPMEFDWSGRVLGEYRLIALVGRGGMGRVYRAEHVLLGRVVALKMVATDQIDAEAVARFATEMLAVGRLSHPNIVSCHDAREIAGVPLLAMEWLDGHDLWAIIRRLGPLSIADTCALIAQAALGLQHAHDHGLVHRDVKPSNLMLTRDGTVKVLDLGLARFLDRSSAVGQPTKLDQILGTADYMAPEQWAEARAVDGRADLYALGCTLFCLLVGRPPFGGPLGHRQSGQGPRWRDPALCGASSGSGG